MNPVEIELLNKRLLALLGQADKNYADILASTQRILLANYKLASSKIKAAIAEMYEKYGDKISYQEAVAYNRLGNLEREIARQIKTMTDMNIRTTQSAIKSIYSDSFYYSAYSFESSLGVKLAFGLLSPEVIRAAVLNPLDRITWPERMRANAVQFTNYIKQELAQGLIHGRGYSHIASFVMARTTMDANKTIRIIRTEGHRVQNAGRVLGFDKLEAASQKIGIETERIWNSTLDDRTRPVPGKIKGGYLADHRHMDGQAAKLNEEGKMVFVLRSGIETEGPGLSGIAEEDINCRCSTRVQVKGLGPKYRKDNISKEIISYKTFDEWFKGRIK